MSFVETNEVLSSFQSKIISQMALANFLSEIDWFLEIEYTVTLRQKQTSMFSDVNTHKFCLFYKVPLLDLFHVEYISCWLSFK